MKPSQILSLMTALGGAACLGASPLVLHIAPMHVNSRILGNGVFFTDVFSLFAAFALTGIAAAFVSNARPLSCVIGGAIGCIAGIELLQNTGFGRGGFADLFYLVAVAGGAWFCAISFVVATILRVRRNQSPEQPS